jgi:hypothetical protein
VVEGFGLKIGGAGGNSTCDGGRVVADGCLA